MLGLCLVAMFLLFLAGMFFCFSKKSRLFDDMWLACVGPVGSVRGPEQPVGTVRVDASNTWNPPRWTRRKRMRSKCVQNAFEMRSHAFGKCVGKRRMRCRLPAILRLGFHRFCRLPRLRRARNAENGPPGGCGQEFFSFTLGIQPGFYMHFRIWPPDDKVLLRGNCAFCDKNLSLQPQRS